MVGFEPTTARLRIECSTPEPHRHAQLHSIAGLRHCALLNYADFCINAQIEIDWINRFSVTTGSLANFDKPSLTNEILPLV
jgi:hypothetical protein